MENKSIISLLNILCIISLLFLSCQKRELSFMVDTPIANNEISPFEKEEILIQPEESPIISEKPESINWFTISNWDRETNRDVADINGTWVSNDTLLDNSSITLDYNYSWGAGKTIVETSLEIDLGKINGVCHVVIPGGGGYLIDNIYKDENEVLYINMFSIEEGNRPLNLEFRFIDNDRIYLISDRKLYNYLCETPWIWYRLSGPSQ